MTSVKTVIFDTGVISDANGVSDGLFGGGNGGFDFAAAQSFNASISYEHVTIQATIGYFLHDSDMLHHFFLSTDIGPDAKDADIVASVSFVVPYDKLGQVGSETTGAYPTVPTILFQDISLTAGTTYYITVRATGGSSINFPYWLLAQNAINGIATYQVSDTDGAAWNSTVPWQSNFTHLAMNAQTSLVATACKPCSDGYFTTDSGVTCNACLWGV